MKVQGVLVQSTLSFSIKAQGRTRGKNHFVTNQLEGRKELLVLGNKIHFGEQKVVKYRRWGNWLSKDTS